MHQNNLKEQLKLHLIVFIWGFTGIIGALVTVEAPIMVWWRMLLASLCLFGYAIYKKQNLKVNTTDFFKLVGTGLIIAAHWVTFFLAIKIANVSAALACIASGALFAALIEPIFFKRKIRFDEIVLGIVSVIGLGLIFVSETKFTWGLIIGLISSFLSVLFAVINGLFTKRMGATKISVFELSGGFLGLSLFMLVSGYFSSHNIGLTASDFFWIVILATICTAFAFVVSVDVMRVLSPFTVVLTINLEPVYGIILAYLVFGEKEKMSFPFYIGTLLIIGAIVWNTWRKRQKRKLLLAFEEQKPNR